MKAVSPGKIVKFADMKPGDFFIFQKEENVPVYAMKVYHDNGSKPAKDNIICFCVGNDNEHPSVVLSPSIDFTLGHTLLVLDNLEIAPIDTCYFIGSIEHDEKPLSAGWLGIRDGGAVLTIGQTIMGKTKVGTVNIASGALLEVPSPGGLSPPEDTPNTVWYQHWRITLPTSTEPKKMIEMNG